MQLEALASELLYILQLQEFTPIFLLKITTRRRNSMNNNIN